MKRATHFHKKDPLVHVYNKPLENDHSLFFIEIRNIYNSYIVMYLQSLIIVVCLNIIYIHI